MLAQRATLGVVATTDHMCFQSVKGYQVSLPLRPSSCHQSLGSPG